MSDDRWTDATTSGGDDAGGAPKAGAPGDAGGNAAPDGDAEGAKGTYPAETLDLGGERAMGIHHPVTRVADARRWARSTPDSRPPRRPRR